MDACTPAPVGMRAAAAEFCSMSLGFLLRGGTMDASPLRMLLGVCEEDGRYEALRSSQSRARLSRLLLLLASAPAAVVVTASGETAGCFGRATLEGW